MLERLQAYNVKMAAKTDTYVEKMETIINAFRFDDKNPSTVLWFLALFKRICNSNGVAEGMAFLVIPNFITDVPASSRTVKTTPRKDALCEYPLPKVGEEQITTYGEAVNYLLMFYVMYRNITNATLVIALLRKVCNKTSV